MPKYSLRLHLVFAVSRFFVRVPFVEGTTHPLSRQDASRTSATCRTAAAFLGATPALTGRPWRDQLDARASGHNDTSIDSEV